MLVEGAAILAVVIVDVDPIVDAQALTLTATYDVESIVDVGRGPSSALRALVDADVVEVDDGVRRLRTASLPSISTMESRSTITSTPTRATCDESSDPTSTIMVTITSTSSPRML